MRVLFVSPAAELGGAERCLLDGVAALRDHGGVASEVLAMTDGPLLEKARALGARVRVVRAPDGLAAFGESGSVSEARRAAFALFSAAPGVAQFIARFRAAIVDARPDVVHSNGMKAHLLAGLLTPKRTRLAVHLHDFMSTRRASKRLLPALARMRPSTVFIAISRAVAEDFKRIAPLADVRTIYNVVDTDYFCEGPAEPDWLSRLAGLEPPAQPSVCFGLVATYARWKGHARFIEAAGLVRQARPELSLRFYVVGGPIYETVGSQVRASELLDQARAANIEANFGLVPFQEDIARVYRALDVVVHASTQPEPFGRTIVEAMACARPVIVARAGGAAELFQDDIDARGFEPESAQHLADAMLTLLDSETRARLGRAARAHAASAFSRGRLAAELLRAYAPGRTGT